MTADPIDCVVIGASGGIGGAFARNLARRAGIGRVLVTARDPKALAPLVANTPAIVTTLSLDLEDEATIASCADNLRAMGAAPRLVIVASGLLHDASGVKPEKSWSGLSAAGLMRNFAINSVGPALVAKHLLPLMPRRERIVFAALSARVGSISDNRLGGWYSYRASKAALNMLIRTLAIELRRRNREGICVGLHPGTVDTSLSSPFQAGVPEGKLFTPDDAAEKLLTVLDGLGLDDTGQLFAWDGQVIPF